MLKPLGRHFRQQLVGYLALFVALGGVSYAALTVTGSNVKDGSLTGRDIKNNSVSGGDLKNNSVGSRDIKDGNLLASDFKPGELVAGGQGPRGDTGATGNTGPTGAAGSPGISGYERVEGPRTFMNLEAEKLGSVACPVGKAVLGGGVEGTQDVPGTLTVSASYPGTSPREWKARVHYTGTNGANEGFIVFAICGIVQ
jgi:hypothetical protein